ncbi:MAG: AMP-binding protein [Chloroflexi bacterium]|nr:AMP-binding protein [Chloroflexota bacterium]
MFEDKRFFHKIEGMAAAERGPYYERQLRRIIRYAYSNSPALRAKLDGAGVKPSQIKTVRDLERIPITPKDDIRRLQKENPPFGGMVTVPISRLKRIFVSPGPIYDIEARDRNIGEVKAFYALGFRPGDLVMNSFSYHMTRGGWSMDEGLIALGCVVIAAGVGNTELQVQVMHDLKVSGFSGTPSFFMTVIKKAEAMGYDFRRDFALKNAYLSAEPFPPSLRRVFEVDYALNVGETYGTAELGLLGYGCPQKSGMHIPEEILMEIVDPKTGKQLPPGEIGEVVMTSLDKAIPIIRIGTGDLSLYTDEPCPCGRTSHRLVRIAGRVSEVVKVRGMFIQPKEVAELVATLPPISNFQMVVSRSGHRDELAFKLELADNLPDRDALLDELHRKFQDVCRVKIDRIECVPGGTIKDSKKLLDTRTWE